MNDSYSTADAPAPVATPMGQVSGMAGSTPIPPVPNLSTLNPRPNPAASPMGGGMSSSTALMVAEDRARRAELTLTVIQQSVNLMKNEATRARIGARWAWAMVALLSGGVVIAVGWTTSIVTRSNLTAESLHDRVVEVRETEQQTAARLERTEDALAAADTARAHAEGQLQEVRAQALKAEEKAAEEARRAEAIEAAVRAAPTTQPGEHANVMHGAAGVVARQD